MKNSLKTIAVTAPMLLAACNTNPECNCPSSEIVAISRDDTKNTLSVSARTYNNPGCYANVTLQGPNGTLDHKEIMVTGDPDKDTTELSGVINPQEEFEVITDGEYHHVDSTGPLYRETSGSCDSDVESL